MRTHAYSTSKSKKAEGFRIAPAADSGKTTIIVPTPTTIPVILARIFSQLLCWSDGIFVDKKQWMYQIPRYVNAVQHRHTGTMIFHEKNVIVVLVFLIFHTFSAKCSWGPIDFVSWPDSCFSRAFSCWRRRVFWHLQLEGLLAPPCGGIQPLFLHPLLLP